MQFFKINSLELGDYLLIYPIYGKSKKIQLKFTKQVLLSEKTENAFDIILPKLNEAEDDFKLELSLIEFQESTSQKIFVLKSLSALPFRINGNLSFHSILEEGDEVIIGLNRLNFMKKQTYDSSLKQVGEHHILQHKNLIESKLNILLEGETGTGKTRLAKMIHEKSGRRGEFVHLNLTNFSPNLIESEIFGHKKGAFTGAMMDRIGALSLADHGTLFIDEIDSLPTALQLKLLLFLDNSTFSPVGDFKNKKVDVRLIFAAGRNLEQLVKRGHMREDFYFRIASGQAVKLKPLRDDPEFLKSILMKFSIDNNISISCKLEEFYLTLPWPGNIRQMLGHLEKKVALNKKRKLDFDEYDSELLLKSTELASLADQSIMSMKELKVNYAKLIYYKFNQNLEQSAKFLGINTKTMKSFITEKLSA